MEKPEKPTSVTRAVCCILVHLLFKGDAFILDEDLQGFFFLLNIGVPLFR